MAGVGHTLPKESEAAPGSPGVLRIFCATFTTTMRAVRRLELSAAARADLFEIWRYTKERWSREQANQYLALIDRGLDALARGTASAVRQRTAPYSSLTVASHHLYFRADKQTIWVVRILHARMDPPRHLPG